VRRRTDQATKRGAIGPTLRAFAVAALAFVLLLQNIAAGTAPSHARRAGVGAATLFSKLCTIGGAGDSQHPDHKAACVLCCGAHDSASPPPRDAASSLVAQRIAVFSDRASISARAPSAQSGWASSWSSRAPPVRA
jgi:hypothetical protein